MFVKEGVTATPALFPCPLKRAAEDAPVIADFVAQRVEGIVFFRVERFLVAVQNAACVGLDAGQPRALGFGAAGIGREQEVANVGA